MATNFSRLWTQQDNLMLENSSRGSSAQYGRNVYLIGGASPANFTDVQRAKIDDSGNIGSFSFDQPLPVATALSTGFSANGYVYCAGGGISGLSSVIDVWYSKVGPDGGLHPWQRETLPYTASQQTHLVVEDKFLYCMGGTLNNGGTVGSSIFVCNLHQDGSFGPWRQCRDLPEGIGLQNRAVYFNGYVYVSLGYTGGGSPTFYSTIWSARMDSNGDLGPWIPQTSFPAAGRIRSASYLMNDLWVITGGSQVALGTTAFGNTWQVRLGIGGTAGPVLDLGNPLPFPVYTPFTAQWKKWVYCLGGNIDSVTRTNIVQRAEMDF